MKNKKGFTLIELIMAIAIIGILATILVPSIMHYVRKARLQAAIADTKVIKSAVESSIVEHLTLSFSDPSFAFNKILYTDQARSKYERVGAFTNYTWNMYKKNALSPKDNKSQEIDYVVAKALEGEFTEKWDEGSRTNPLGFNTASHNCADYVESCNTNFGLVIVYNTTGGIRMIQCYRKGVLVTYINGEYIANDDPTAHFIGRNYWENVYKDVGRTAPDSVAKLSIANQQFRSDNPKAKVSWGGWS